MSSYLDRSSQPVRMDRSLNAHLAQLCNCASHLSAIAGAKVKGNTEGRKRVQEDRMQRCEMFCRRAMFAFPFSLALLLWPQPLLGGPHQHRVSGSHR